MEDKELFNPQTGEKIAPKRPKKFYQDWRFYVYSLIALMLAIVSVSSAVTACAAINAGVGQNEGASYSVAQRKNAGITTDGGYTGYQILVENDLYSGSLDNGTLYYHSWDVSNSDYSLSNQVNGTQTSVTGNNIISFLPSIADSVQSASSNQVRFLSVFGKITFSSGTYDIRYFTFVLPNATAWEFNPIPFIYTNKGNAQQSRLDVTTNVGLAFQSSYILGSSRTNYYLYSSDTQNQYAVFQDVVSYYKGLGYQDGYDDGYAAGNTDGYTAGESAGYASGYTEGLEVGNSNGEANGYANGYAAGLNASNYFKSITANNDLVFFDILANITPYYTDGNGNLYYYRIFSAEVGEDFYYCWLCYYSTSNWTSWDVFLVWCDQSSSSGFTLDYLKNNSLGVWVVPKSNGAFSSVQSYAVYEPSIKTLDNAKVSLVYNVQMMQAYVTLDGGRTYGDVYEDGYTTGYQNGYNYGYELGETAGINAAEPEALTTTLVAVFQQPFNQIYRFFNFNILGLNVLGLATGLLSVFIIIKVFKKVLK